MSSRLQLLNMNVGDSFLVNGDAFHVLGKIVYSENSFTWTEFKVRDNYGGILWLTVEDQAEIVNLAQKISFSFQKNTEFEYNGIIYKLKESGKARVVRASGDVDVEINEEVEYYDYVDETGQYQMEIEVWEDEVEASISSSVNLQDIQVKERSYNRNYGNNQGYQRESRGRKGGFIKAILILFVVVALFSVVKNAFGSGKDPKSYLKEDSKYAYKTSVTADYGKSERADVYETNMSVEAAAKDILKNTRPKENSKTSGVDNVSALYSNYYLFVYEGDDGKTLVQISSREYAYRSKNNLYGARYSRHNSFFRDYYFYKALTSDRRRYGTGGYYSSYSPKYNSSSFGGTSRSVRRTSTTTRRSTGGGTGFGK